MEQTVNSFNKGINSDLALTVPQNESALDIFNFRVTTETGGSSYALVNIKGTDKHIEFGTTSSVHNITYTGTLGLTNTLVIGFDGYADAFTPTSWSTLKELYIQLADFINASLLIQGALSYKAYAQDTGVLVYSPNSLGPISVSLSDPDYTSTVIVNSLSDFYIIGWTIIRDNVVLLTTQTAFVNPGGINPDLPSDPAAAGQIWVMSFDALNNPTIELVYNNIVNFSTEHPVASPGAIIGRYESPTIQRIYWTDNFNKPRTLNVADPEAFGVPIQSLLVQRNTKLSTPILQRVIQSGSVLTGMHQYAYRLKSNSGATTVFSLPSNLASVTNTSEETGAYIDYRGSFPTNLSSGKSLQYTISGLDLTYDRIEIANIYFKDATTAVPEVNIIADEPIPSSGVFTFTHSGTEVVTPITIEEYTAFTATIERVKSIESKNNRLFLGNIRERKLSLNYDARAFRYKHDGTTYVTPTDILNLKSDCINPNQSPIPHEEGYIFMDPTTTGGNLVYGGNGVNISYTFTPDSASIDAQDADALAAKIQLDTESTSWTTVPYRSVPRTSVSRSLNATVYPVVNTFNNFAVPYVSSVIRGYTRDEIYSFGIVFYDLLGNPGFVNWIGDIRMPHAFMPDPLNPTTDSDRLLAFKPSLDSGSFNITGYSLGIKFNIHVPDEIKAQVSGFSIVRCERKQEDRTILGQGIMVPGWSLPADDNCFLVDDGMDIDGSVTAVDSNDYANGTTNIHDINTDFASLYIPEHLFGDIDFNFINGDGIDVVARLNESSIGNMLKAPSTPVDDYGGSNTRGWVTKNYGYDSNPITFMYDGGANYNAFMPLRDAFTWEAHNEFRAGLVRNDLSTPAVIFNLSVPHTKTVGGFPLDISYCGGPKCLVVASGDYGFGGNSFGNIADLYNDNSILTTYNGSTYDLSYRHLLVNYKRTLTNQYGGNTYSKRSGRIYISTGHFQQIDSTSANDFTSTIYGGDTFITAFDVCPRKKRHIGGDYRVPPGEEIWKSARISIFVVETTTNTELRRSANGGVPNKDYMVDDTSTAVFLDIDDEYTLEPTYYRESTAYPFTAEPAVFNELFDFDTRIRASEQKINGEIADSWAIFKNATYIDLEGIYGPIVNLVVSDDELYAFQESAFAKVAVNTRALLNDNSGTALQLGTAGLLSRYDYISTEIGIQHQWGIVVGNSAIYFLDGNKKELFRYSNTIESLGKLKGINGYLNTHLIGTGMLNDNPVQGKGITCTFDYKFNEVLFTFHTSYFDQFLNQSVTRSWTLAYNELLQLFTRYGLTPHIYINAIDSIYACEDRQNIHQLDIGNYAVFFGAPPQNSSVKFVVNPNPSTTKKFDVLNWNTSVYDDLTAQNPIERSSDTWTRLRAYNSFQNTGFINLIPKPALGYNTTRSRNREWRYNNLRNAVITNSVNVDILNPVNLDTTQINKPRLYDNYLIMDFEYNNANNYRFISPFIITYYRQQEN